MSSRPGDWNCRSCQHLNFQRRDSCQRCGEPRPSSYGPADYFFGTGRSLIGSPSFGFNTGPDVRPGDWYCTVAKCNAHNFASRSSCFKCGASKDDSSSSSSATATTAVAIAGYENELTSRFRGFGLGGGSSGGGSSSGRSGWKSGDWICTRCNEHNFANRMECFGCKSPRESYGSSKPSY